MPIDEPTIPARTQSWLKPALIALLIILFLTVACLMFGTERGREIIQNHSAHGAEIRNWVSLHPLIAPLYLLLIYTVLTVLSLPVWWLPILAGYGFGLVMGVFWAQLAYTCAALTTVSVSRFLLSDWFHQRIESHAARLRALDEKAGHNGLLVVCGVRLMHVIPAGLSNYAFGLTNISMIDIAIGTFIGGLPGAVIGVTFGAGRHLLHDWRYICVIVALRLIPIAGLILRYLKPDWFRSVGIE